MRALTLTQPWATLVAIGAKKIETRSWATPYRGRLLIHAGTGLGPVGGKKGLIRQCARKHFLPALDAMMPAHLHGIGSPASIVERLPLGAIVAACDLIAVLKTDNFPIGVRGETAIIDGNGKYHIINVTDQEIAFGDYSTEPRQRYAWVLDAIRVLPEPVPCKGALGLWVPDAAVIAQVREQVEQ